MIQYKISTICRVPVRLVDLAGNPIVGSVFGDVTASVEKSDGTTASITMGAGQWAEVTAGPFLSQGYYNLLIPASATDLAGILSYAVAVSGAITYIGVVQLVTNEVVDLASTISTINSNVTTISSNVTTINTNVTQLRRIAEGKWEIMTSGPDVNNLILYSADGTTIIQQWQLFDVDGNAATSGIFKRVPTISIP